MKRALATISLASMLSISALAGEIPTVNVTSVMEEPVQTTSSTSSGEIPSAGYTNQMSDAALNFIQIMVGLVV